MGFVKKKGLGAAKCNSLYVKHDRIASCGIIDSKLEIALNIKGCNLYCKYCWAGR